MKNIAIFVSGAGESAERIVKLFNEGNRVKTVLVIVDDSGLPLLESLKEEDVKLVHIPDSEWHQRSGEIADLIRENDVKLLVLDKFAHSISDEIMETTHGELLIVSDSDHAPREVVAALEADLRKPVEEKPEEDPIEDSTPEREWAQTLNIQYRPPKIPTTPPEVPITELKSSNEEYEFPEEVFQVSGAERQVKSEEHQEPMPSTWLIWSILVTVFCCFIPGIIAIIFSTQVSSKYYSGDVEGARRSSRMAEIWIIVSFVLGVLSATLYVPFMLIGW